MTVFSTETPVKLCHGCGHRKVITDFRNPRFPDWCAMCRPPSDLGAVPLTKRPSGEVIDSIRRISAVATGNSEAVFEKYGMPETRERAAEILRIIQNDRWANEKAPLDTTTPAADPPDEEELMRECVDCHQEKPVDQYDKRGRGYSKTCRSCESRDLPTAAPDLEDPAEESESLVRRIAEHPIRLSAALSPFRPFAFLEDPRLSQLTALQDILTEIVHSDTSLDMVIDVCAALAAWEPTL